MALGAPRNVDGLSDPESSIVTVVVEDSELSNEKDAVTLATLGYKQELRRNFSVVNIFSIAFSMLGLLPSMSITLVYALPAGPAGLVWGWICAGLFIVCTALAIAELASAMPTSGGYYYWTYYYASPKTRKPLCFLVGYSNTLSLTMGLCAIDYGFATMLLSIATIATDAQWTASRGVIYAVLLCTLCAHGVLASTCAGIMPKIQNTSSCMQIFLIVATVIALPVGSSHRNDASFMFTKLDNLTAWPNGFAFVLSWLMTMWTVAAFDGSVHMSEEALNAVKAVPMGILSSTGLSLILGWACVLAITSVISSDLNSVLNSELGQPIAQIYYDALGKHTTIGFMTVFIVCQFAIGLSTTVIASRQMWAFSRDGALPFSNFFRRIYPSRGYIPLGTVWAVVFIAAIGGILAVINQVVATAILSLGLASLYLAWGTPIFARLFLAKDRFRPGPFYLGRTLSTINSCLALAFMCFGIVLSMMPLTGPNPTANEMNYTVLINGTVWFGALAYYFIDARKWFKGPKITIAENHSITEEEEQRTQGEELNLEVIRPSFKK